VSEREEGLTIEELAARVGVPVRTVRFYITEGLLPGPGARGRGASYGREHLLRLRLVRRLAERRVPIAEIRETLTRLSTSEVAALLEEEARKAAELQQTPPATSPRAYVAALLKHSRTDAGETPKGRPPAVPDAPHAGSESSWRRMELAPGVELHVRGDAAVRQRDLIARISAAAGEPRAPRAPRASGEGPPADNQDGQDDQVGQVDSISEDEAGSGASGGTG
jgi:DNA-binding transcriptional MerR regulator